MPGHRGELAALLGMGLFDIDSVPFGPRIDCPRGFLRLSTSGICAIQVEDRNGEFGRGQDLTMPYSSHGPYTLNLSPA